MITIPMHVQTMLAIRKTDVTMQPVPVTQATLLTMVADDITTVNAPTASDAPPPWP